MLETSQALSIIILFATVIQFCVERVKELVGGKVMEYVRAPLWALAFGVLFAFMFRIDVFAMFGYNTASASYTVVAYIVSGFILSAGAAPIHDLVKAIRNRINSDQDSSTT